MFSNAIRRQARIALGVAVRQTASPSLLARVARPNPISLRALSTTLSRFDAPMANPSGPPRSENPPSRQLFMGNLSYDATEADIRDTVAQFGEVESVRLIVNPDGSSRGFGYVTFLQQSAADECLRTGVQIFGRPLRIDYTAPQNTSRTPTPITRTAAPPGRVLFVGNLPYGTEETDLREKFEPFGPIKSIRIATRPGGEPRGFAHVEYLRDEDSIAAYESFAEEPLYMLDRNVRVDYAPVRPTSTNPPSHRLYFFDYRGNEEALRTTLNEFETSIQRVYFLRSQMTGELTGSGFVEFMSVERATQALQKINGSITPYGPINLEYALNKQRAPQSAAPGGSPYAGRQQNPYAGGYGGGQGGYGQGSYGQQGGYGQQRGGYGGPRGATPGYPPSGGQDGGRGYGGGDY
ncbi:hypothetical protein MVEN_01663300 [Mycena venus]|uniref:RRM domain-containing protein n=1 Tax=Mycena venus TaxID=2733690 RepID=A0A8H6XRH3_9AGAR|nr:hypothetical protein MVEN_01663300 [Mycena venus]